MKAVVLQAVRPFLAVVAALAIGFVIIWLVGLDAFGAYRILFQKGFLTANALQETLERTVPLTFTGLAVAMAFRSGVFNLGVEGQLYMGAAAGFVVGWSLNLPPVLHSVVAIMAGAMAGALFALPPAIARVRWKADEVVSTIMLNYVAILFTSYLVARPFKDTTAGAQQTWPIAQSAHLFRFFETSRVHTGLIVVLVMAAVVYFYMFHTPRGYELRMVGMNPLFAEYAGINPQGAIVRAMLWSGSLGGMAGAVEVLGIHHKLIDMFSPGYGFDGIVVALMARNNPIAVVLAAFLYGGLKTGAAYMDRLTDVPKELNDALQGILIFLVAAEGLFHFANRNGALGGKLNSLMKLFRTGSREKEVS